MAESEMIERVAREIYEVAYGDGGWAEVEDSVRLSFLGQARAAIEATRKEIENIYASAESRYEGDWGSIFEEFTVRTRESFDAALSPSTKEKRNG